MSLDPDRLLQDLHGRFPHKLQKTRSSCREYGKKPSSIALRGLDKKEFNSSGIE